MQRGADWGLAGGEACSEDGLVVFRVGTDEGTAPAPLDVGLYFLVEKTNKHTPCAYFLLSLFLFIKCIIKYNLKNSMLPSSFYALLYQKAGIPFSAARLETDALMC